MFRFALVVFAASLFGIGDLAQAAVITLTPTADLYVKNDNSTNRGQAYDANGANSEGGGVQIRSGTTRQPILQYDLSSVPGMIIGASLTGRPTTGSSAAVTTTAVIVPYGVNSFGPIPESTFTRNIYNATYSGGAIALGGLGVISVGDQTANFGSDISLGTATPADVAILENIRTHGTSQSLLILITGSGSANLQFDDKEATASPIPKAAEFPGLNPVRLTIEYVPEPSTLILGAAGLAALGCRLRRRKFGKV
jgi:hypothetical protein